MSTKVCATCGKELYIGTILSGSSLCSLCWNAANARPRRPSASPTASPAPKLAPAAEPPEAVEGLGSEESTAVERIVAMANGGPQPSAPAGDDEESACVARIAAMANGGPLVSAGDDDAETRAVVERIRQHDESHLAEARRARGAS